MLYTRWNLENGRKDLREKDIRGGGNSITVHVPFNLITLGNLASFQPPVTTALPLTNNIVDDPAGAFWFDLLYYKSVLLGSRQQNRESLMIGRSTEKDEWRKDLKRVKETGIGGNNCILLIFHWISRFLNYKILILLKYRNKNIIYILMKHEYAWDFFSNFFN